MTAVNTLDDIRRKARLASQNHVLFFFQLENAAVEIQGQQVVLTVVVSLCISS
jgi:hypothetical protein